MRILVTNDDGIDSVGLHVLARAMTAHGDVTIVAPDREFSGAGAALGALHTMHPEVYTAHVEGVPTAWAVSGPPALCIMFARLGVFGPRFDLVVSGINPGANVGRSVYHSGTVGAVLTGRNAGISGVAVSQAVTGMGVEGQGWDDMIKGQRWSVAADVASSVVAALVADMPAQPVAINLNVPNLPLEEIKGWRETAVGSDVPRPMSVAELEPKEGHDGTYHVRMNWGSVEVALPDDSDGGAVERGYVSLTYLTRLERLALASPTAAEAGLDGLFQR